MRYRIEYADGRCCNFANSRKDSPAVALLYRFLQKYLPSTPFTVLNIFGNYPELNL